MEFIRLDMDAHIHQPNRLDLLFTKETSYQFMSFVYTAPFFMLSLYVEVLSCFF